MNRAIILQNNQPSNATNQSIALEGCVKVDQNGKGKICREVCLLLVDYIYIYMDVSENNGTPKSSILIGISIINHPFWGTHIFGNTHIHNHFHVSTEVFDFLYLYLYPPQVTTARKKNDGWKTFFLGWYIFRGYVKLPGGIHLKPPLRSKKVVLKKTQTRFLTYPKHSMRPTSCLYVYLQMYKQIDQPPLSVWKPWFHVFFLILYARKNPKHMFISSKKMQRTKKLVSQIQEEPVMIIS